MPTKKDKSAQLSIEGVEDFLQEDWQKEWEGMPEFNQQDLTSYQQIIVHFENKEDVEKFVKLIGQNISSQTRSIWYPEAEIGRIAGRAYFTEEKKKK